MADVGWSFPRRRATAAAARGVGGSAESLMPQRCRDRHPEILDPKKMHFPTGYGSMPFPVEFDVRSYAAEESVQNLGRWHVIRESWRRVANHRIFP
jgi:hypothetical protein